MLTVTVYVLKPMPTSNERLVKGDSRTHCKPETSEVLLTGRETFCLQTELEKQIMLEVNNSTKQITLYCIIRECMITIILQKI